MKRTATALTFALRLSLAAMIPVAVGASAAGCADENDPATWVKRLDDPAQRAPAIKRLGQFYEDAMTKAGKKHDDPGVKKVLDTIVDPMAKTYIAGGLDEKTRKDLIKGLGDMRDARTSPAFTKAFAEFELGKNDDDVKFAAEAVGAMAKEGAKFDQALIDALWSCFTKYKPSKTNSIQGTQALHDAILAVKDASYGPKAVEAISKPLTLDDSVSEKGTRKTNDQLEFWQTTSVQLISALKYKPAAKALVSVMMTKNKLGLALIAQKALLAMGNDAVPLLSGALNGTDPELAKQQLEWKPENGFVPVMMSVLSYISTPVARDAIYTALPGLDTDANRAAAAQSLVWFPVDATLLATYKGIYAKLPPIADKTDTGSERAQVLQVAGEFYDPALLPWALTESSGAKGVNMLTAKVGALTSAIKLMQPEQKKAVADALTNLEGSGLSVQEKQAVSSNVRAVFTFASETLDKCNKDTACYLGVLGEPIAPVPNANWRAIKAAAMCGILGNDQTRGELVAKLPKIKNPGARLATVVAINHLTPAGDAAVADALEKIVREDTERKDAEALKGDDALVKVALMLRARAGK
jgi:hypothetical protein